MKPDNGYSLPFDECRDTDGCTSVQSTVTSDKIVNCTLSMTTVFVLKFTMCTSHNLSENFLPTASINPLLFFRFHRL